MDPYQIERKVVLPRPRPEVFAFFADAHNLEDLTPTWLRFQVITPRPIPMEAGTLIDYRLRLHGIPIRWTSRISLWEPPHRFVDEQIRGPYRVWRHLHSFEDTDEGTVVHDIVEYAVPGGKLVNRWLVKPDVERIFDFRGNRLRDRFGGSNGDGVDDRGE